MTKVSIRLPCPNCATSGEVPDDEMTSGWKTCGTCYGSGWQDETPQPHGEPHPDPQPAPLP